MPSERTQDNGSGYLYITSVEPSDSGVYICTASDGYSSFSDKKTLKIAGKNININLLVYIIKVLSYLFIY